MDKVPLCFPVFYNGLINDATRKNQPDSIGILIYGDRAWSENRDKSQVAHYISGKYGIPNQQAQEILSSDVEVIIERVKRLNLNKPEIIVSSFHIYLLEHDMIDREQREQLEKTITEYRDPYRYIVEALKMAVACTENVRGIMTDVLKKQLRGLCKAENVPNLFTAQLSSVQAQCSHCQNNLPPKNRYFIGRKSELQLLQQNIDSGHHIQTIYGLAGVGKTQLATAYARNNMDRYDIIWFINAESNIELKNSCNRFLGQNGIKIEPGDYQGDADQINLLRFRKYFETTALHWLLIYDNAVYSEDETEADLSISIPSSGNGSIIITTQTTIPYYGAPQVAVDVFDQETARSFLWSRTGRPLDEYAEELIELYEGHALALEYASAYIVQAGRSYEEYVSILKKNGSIKMLNKKRFGGGQTYKGTIIEAYNATIQRIRREAERDPAMARVEPCLKFIAALLDGNIYVPFIERIHETLKAPLDEAFKDALETDETVFALTKYSLMTRNGNQLYMHRLLREIILDGMEDNGYEAIRDYAKNYYDVFIPMDEERQAIIDKYDWRKRISALFKLDFITRSSIENGKLLDLVLGYTMVARIDRAKDYILWKEVNKEKSKNKKERPSKRFDYMGERLVIIALKRCMSLCADIDMKPEKTRERLFGEIMELTEYVDGIGHDIIQRERINYFKKGGRDVEQFVECLHQLYQEEDWMTPEDYHALVWVFQKELGLDEELIRIIQDDNESDWMNGKVSFEEYLNSNSYKHYNEVMNSVRTQRVPETIISILNSLFWFRECYFESEDEFADSLAGFKMLNGDDMIEKRRQRDLLYRESYRDTFDRKEAPLEGMF